MINSKRTSEKKKEQEKKYPKLMSVKEKYKTDPNDNLVVLMTRPKCGCVVVATTNNYGSLMMGQNCTSWNMDDFEDYVGQVILENE